MLDFFNELKRLLRKHSQFTKHFPAFTLINYSVARKVVNITLSDFGHILAVNKKSSHVASIEHTTEVEF